MAESLIEHNYETEQISINDSLPDLKNSIKSSYIKDMLKEEDNKKEMNSKKEKEKGKLNGNKSKNKNNEISKKKKNNDMNNDQFQIEIKKVRPKSKTIKKLINDHQNQNKTFIKSKTNKNKINREQKQNLTNIIDTKSASTKKINIKIDRINNKPKENNIKAKVKNTNIPYNINSNSNLNFDPYKKNNSTNTQKSKNGTERTKPKTECLINKDLKVENI